MNVCDNLGDHLVGNVYVKVRMLPLVLLRYCATWVCASNVFYNSSERKKTQRKL